MEDTDGGVVVELPVNKTQLNPKRGTLFDVDPNELVLVTDPRSILYQERVHRDPDPDLVASMLANGFTSVIQVRRNGPKLEVVTGRQRTIAAREVNRIRHKRGELPLLKVAVQLVQSSSELGYLKLAVAENATRTTYSIIDRARDIRNLLNFGADPEEVYGIVKLGEQMAQNYLQLLDLDPALQREIDEGDLALGPAIALAALSREDQIVKYQELKSEAIKTGGKITEGKVKAAVKTALTGVKVNPKLGTRTLNKLLKREDLLFSVVGDEGIELIKAIMGKPYSCPPLDEVLRIIEQE